MFVTTAGRTNEEMVDWAKRIAADLSVDFVARKKMSVQAIQDARQDDCLVVGKNRLELYHLGEREPFFFHPNSAMFRIKRLMKGETDPLIEAAGLRAGMSFLDCTLGLGADSIVASFVTGNRGRNVGVEAKKELFYLVKQGLGTWSTGLDKMDEAMQRIEVIHEDAMYYLAKQDDNSFDCVYFDPMFEESILESDGIKGLSSFAHQASLTEELMDHALRVAGEKVILKDHFRSSRFKTYGFSVLRRPSAKFHYGVIEKE